MCAGPKSSLFDRSATAADLDAAESRLYELGDPTGDAARIEDLQTQLATLQVSAAWSVNLRGNARGCVALPNSASTTGEYLSFGSIEKIVCFLRPQRARAGTSSQAFERVHSTLSHSSKT